MLQKQTKIYRKKIKKGMPKKVEIDKKSKNEKAVQGYTNSFQWKRLIKL